MPPRTRGIKVLKASKENIDILVKNNGKDVKRSTKPARKPLADKTNSASDENTTSEPQKKVVKPDTKIVSKVIDEKRPRRTRRLPTRYVENQVLNNLSNSKEVTTTPNKSGAQTPVKNASKVESPFKQPMNVLENSLVFNRQRRVSRLPSKFDDTVSPDKFVPLQPCHTSTPLVQHPRGQPKKVENPPASEQKKLPLKTIAKKATSQKVTPEKIHKELTPIKSISRNRTARKLLQKKIIVVGKMTVGQDRVTPMKPIPKKGMGKKLVQTKITEVVNTSVGQERVTRLRKPVKYKEVTMSPKLKSPVNSKPNSTPGKIFSKVNSSFRVFEENKPKNGNSQDVYEFTFDPSEEPQMKKRKKVVNKKPSKPKQRVYKNNYEKNLARAMADLKKVVAKQNEINVEPSAVTKPTTTVIDNNPTQAVGVTAVCSTLAPVSTQSSVAISTVAEIHPDPVTSNYSRRSNVSNKNHASIRVEDIAAGFETTIDHDDINYSPANSPQRIQIASDSEIHASPVRDVVRSDDPLNLRNDLSAFDDQPVASSSMNISSRDPMSTPWRVEFKNLPIKWQADTYVKPDMTPALESSYINNFNDSTKKHVYTNMIERAVETIQEIRDNDAPKLKQTSIISFIKEVVEKKANKKNKGTPTKAKSLFDASNASINAANSDTSHTKKTSEVSSNNTSSENDPSIEIKKAQKRKNVVDINPTPVKLACRDDENTLFGFDDSENEEQENIAPIKFANPKGLRNLRSRSGAALKELNKQAGPMRAELPAAMKSKLAPSSDVVDKIYGQMKSAADAPVMLENQGNGVNTNITEMPKDRLESEDSQSVHLFEDVQLVHHLKPVRKSYGKSKKVTFMQNSSDNVGDLLSDDDADDLSFHLPEAKAKKATKKKKTKKQELSAKEKKEADAWAAGFNSMCEDVDEFDLVVE